LSAPALADGPVEAPCLPRMVRVPAPACQPPFDDELAGHPAPALPGQLLLAVTAGRPRPSLGAAAATSLADTADEEDGPAATPRTELPPPGPWAARFARAFAEVLAASRPARQLMRWATWPVYEELETVVGTLGGGARPVLVAVRVSEPADSVAEACAVVRIGERCRALALRFEGLDGRWQCTAARIG
jgi:hypothetical protein